MNCPFCDPKDRVLKENPSAYIMLSNPRRVEGHFLVIPKRHIEKPWEMTQEESKDLFDLIKFVQERVVKKVATGCDTRQSYRPFVAQDGRTKMNHVHYHVVARNPGDRLAELDKMAKTLFEDLSQEEHDRIAMLFREAEN